MGNLNINEVKKIEIDILLYIKALCEKYNLRYYLAYGTLIGAVRHKGFIPWDDDIDIWMPIEDYKKFIRIKEDSKYNILEWNNTKDYYYPFAKVVDSDTKLIEKDDYSIEELGVYVDIFPLIGIDNNLIVKNLKSFYISIILKEWRYAAIKKANYQNNIIKKFLRYIPYKYAKYKGVEYWLHRIEKYEFANSTVRKKYIGDISGTCAKNFLDKEKLGEFENNEFSIPYLYDQLLTSYYGDYMKLPSKENRISNHNFIAYYK